MKKNPCRDSSTIEYTDCRLIAYKIAPSSLRHRKIPKFVLRNWSPTNSGILILVPLPCALWALYHDISNVPNLSPICCSHETCIMWCTKFWSYLVTGKRCWNIIRDNTQNGILVLVYKTSPVILFWLIWLAIYILLKGNWNAKNLCLFVFYQSLTYVIYVECKWTAAQLIWKDIISCITPRQD